MNLCSSPWMNAAYAAWGCVLAKSARRSISWHHLEIFFSAYALWNDSLPMAAPRCLFPSDVTLMLVPANRSAACCRRASSLMMSHDFLLLTKYPNLSPSLTMQSHHSRSLCRLPAPVASSASQTWLTSGVVMRKGFGVGWFLDYIGGHLGCRPALNLLAILFRLC